LLVRLLELEINWHIVQAARTSARRLWGAEALEPDYALLQNRNAASNYRATNDVQESLKRVCERGEPRRMFEILPKCPEATQEALALSLLNRPNLPMDQILGALSGNSERSVQLAARLVGRGGADPKAAAKPLQTALERWLKAWEDRRQRVAQENRRDDPTLARLTPCVQALVWAAGRLGVAQPLLLTVAQARPDDRMYRPIRIEAVAALASAKLTDAVEKLLETVAVGNDPEIRTLATDALAKQRPKVAAKLAEPLLSDRVSFNRLTADGIPVEETLRKAASQVHYQGVALPHLVASGDVATLAEVAQNRKLPEATRLGAVEALARMACETAEAKLVEIGKGEGKEEEELRKAAWRGLRRSKRARKKAQAVVGPKGMS
ncbi:MAG TPA: hypothetical protein VEL76_31125, partial [Gemmataceae bacterium]|nr:hypothetical protein [Gemmataceae bacterium]